MEGQYYVLEIDKWGDKPTLRKKSFRNLEPHEILVRIECTTIHPADLMFIKGEYGSEKPHYFHIVPGFEGSGEVIKAGDAVDKTIVGKRVGLFANANKTLPFDGLWAQYYYTTVPEIIPFDINIPYERMCFTINPLTAIGMFDTIKKNNAKAIIQNAASSSVARMLYKLCCQDNIQVVNLVKDKDKANILYDRGTPQVINKEDSNWEDACKKLCVQLGVKIGFDCVGGDTTSKMLSILPRGSILYHTGNLEVKDLSNFKSKDFIFDQKILTGWWLPVWIINLAMDELAYYIRFFVTEVESNSDLFKTEVAKEYSLREIENAIVDYVHDMDKGKVIIKPYLNI